jgi:myo-inositol 2-dehydrogenase/D-chiro-inositol 1-dehydrogenase
MRIGIIGAGFMGRAHAAGWAETNAEVVGIADPDRARGEALAARYGWKCFDGLEAILPEVDVVDLCVPTHLHHEMVLRSARAGKHIMCEKPIALTVEHGKEMIAACKAAGVRLFIGMVIHFFPEYQAVKRAIDAGQIGAPQVIRLSRVSSRPQWSLDDWIIDEAKSGGMIIDLMIHDFECARWWGGEVKRVFAKSVRAQNPKVPEDHALAILRFRSGAIAHIEGSWAYPVPTFSYKIEVAGDAGLIEFDRSNTMPIIAHLHKAEGEAPDVALPGSPLAEDPWCAEVKHFWDVLKNDMPFAVTAEDALAGLRIALAARASAQTGKPVTLKPLEVA